MRNNSHLRSQERSACMQHVLAAIGRQLRARHDIAQPVPPRLAELIRQIAELPGEPGARVRNEGTVRDRE